MIKLTIETNNHKYEIIHGFELSEKERQEFDYYSSDELDSADFVRYKGNIYDLNEFMGLENNTELSQNGKWNGYFGETYFSGVLIQLPYIEEIDPIYGKIKNYDYVRIGSYYS